MTKSPGPKLPQSLQFRATHIAAGDDFVCAIVVGTPDKVRCWGNNDAGQLGVIGASTSVQDVALPAGFAPPFDRILAGGRRACVRAGPRAVCWGANDSGQIDPGTNPALPRDVNYAL